MMIVCVASFIFWSITIKMLFFFMSIRSSEITLSQLLRVGRSHALLSPNIGIQWYLFMSLFERCRQFFIVMSKGLPFLLFIPLSIRFYRYPTALVSFDIKFISEILFFCITMIHQIFFKCLHQVVIYYSILSILKQCPTLQDLSISLAIMQMEPRTLARMPRFTIIPILAIPITISLFIVDYWLWLESGAGNPNYLFFQCLAYNIFFIIITLQFVSSTMKRDKALRLTEKSMK